MVRERELIAVVMVAIPIVPSYVVKVCWNVFVSNNTLLVIQINPLTLSLQRKVTIFIRAI